MGKTNIFHEMNLIVLSQAISRGAPLPDPVDGNNSGTRKRRDEKRACRMRQMVLDKQNRSIIFKSFFYDLYHPQFFGEPRGQGA